MMMKFQRYWLSVILVITCLAALALPAAAQDQNEEFRVNVRRNFGLSSGSQIRGTFTVSIIGPEDQIERVTFLLDGEEMAQVNAAPFNYRFQTDDYEFGWHDIAALVITRDGRELRPTARRFEFVSPGAEMEVVGRILVPLGIGVLALMVVGVGIQFLVLRNAPPSKLAPGAARTYGIKGGTICPRCGRPYPIHWWSINLGVRYFDRCDFCGKWALVRRLSHSALQAAEQAELESAQMAEAAPTLDPEEEMRRRLDESRYSR